MYKTLGLDLGTNSLGWCLIEDNKKIISTGVRIFPVGVKEDDYKKLGKEVSKNVDRRSFRGARRRRFRFKIRQKALLNILAENNMLPSNLLSTFELYQLRKIGLDTKIELNDFGKILMMLNKRRGFKSNKKYLKTAEAKKEDSEVKEGIKNLQDKINQNGSRTVGEYFANLFLENKNNNSWHNKDEAVERIRKRWVGREMYLYEFDLLWEKQKSFYPEILTNELKTTIRDEIIYYQRNLKSQKGLVGKCRFEPNKRCAAKSSVLFQEFRIRQDLSNIRFAKGSRIGESLTKEEIDIILNYLNYNYKITITTFIKLLNLSKNDFRNEEVENLKGNSTLSSFNEVFGQETMVQLTNNHIFELCHLLSFTNNTEKLISIVKRKINQNILPKFSDEQIEKFSEINLVDGYCNFSSKALNKILPFMRTGQDAYNSFILAGYKPGEKITTTGKIYEINKLEPLKPNELRNPIVQQILSETFRVVNKIIKKFGKPDMVRVELARDLKKPKEVREQINNKAKQKFKQREAYAEFLSKTIFKGKKIETNSPEIKKYELWLEMGCQDESLNNLKDFFYNGKVKDETKYKLWKECNRISVYSGKVISLSKLFSPEIEIEHIWPYSKTMNNEFTNLCLCEGEINEDKGNLLPLEYFARKGKIELEKFKKRVEVFGKSKKFKFLSTEIPPDFLNSQINNTSYAARELIYHLETILPPINVNGENKKRVQVVNGQATSVLRKLWGLNAILNYGDINTKNRNDHRHHAIDALTIACTTPRLLHILASNSKFRQYTEINNPDVQNNLPWKTFLKDTSIAINNFIVSFRNQKKITSTKLNKIKNASPQKSISIRGALHEETLFGQIEIGKEKTFVTRWPISKFEKESQLDKIVDSKVREIILKRVKKYGSVKEAVKDNPDDPILMYSPNANAKIPIKKVRVTNNSENLILIRKETNTFVESGNNYAIAFYKNQNDSNTKFKTITFFDAVQKSLLKKPVIPKFYDDGTPLTFYLMQKDIVVRYQEHPDEINWDDFEELRTKLFRIRKFDVNGIIVIDYLFAGNIDDKNDRNKIFFNVNQNTLKCIKVEVNEIGEITKKWL